MIPRVIHYCWFGGAEKSEMIRRCVASWQKYCPDYEIIEWNESNYDVTAQPFVRRAYEAKKWAFVSDYARIDILNRQGGVYLDTDVELLKPLDPFLAYDFFAGFESRDYVAFGLGFGAVAGHPVLRDILNTYAAIDFTDDPLALEKTSCPKIQTEALKKVGLICDNRNQTPGGCHIFSTEYFCPMSFETGQTVITENTVSIHHYDMSWFMDAYRKAKQQEWRMVRRFGPRWGKRVASLLSFPAKLAAHAQKGTLFSYLRSLLRH